MEFLRLLFLVIMENRAEVSEGDGQGGSPAEGQGEAPGSEETQPEGEGQAASTQDGQAAAPKPRYGDFGDNPKVDDVYSRYQELQGKIGEYEGRVAKMSATERNLATLRKTLEGHGVKVLSDSNGNIQLVPDESRNAPAARAKKFNDQHKALFDEPVYTAIEALIEDRFSDFFDKSFEDRFKSVYQRQQEASVQYNVAKQQANGTLVKMFPMIAPKDANGGDNPSFNKAFWEKATEIWHSNPEYKRHPKGELFAAVDAAAELGISAQAIQQAKKEGFQRGQESKKVLSPVSSSGKGTKVGTGKLTQDEYMALPPDQRLEYDKKQKGL